MDPYLRKRFNEAWTEEIHAAVESDIRRRLGCPIPFPVAETPVFLAQEVRDRFVTAAREILERVQRPECIERGIAAVPPELRRTGHGTLPQFAQIDLAIVREPDGSLGPRLVELQGFPSLYGFQILLADAWATRLASMPGLPEHWRLFFSGMDRYQAMALLREAILGAHEPEDVVLLDFHPQAQKTFPDFAATQRWFGVDPVCPTELVREGREIFRRKSGRTIPVRRIFHRIIWDELEASPEELPFDLRDDIDVEWAPHPAWFYIWSKNSLIGLDHPAVPRTNRLSDLSELPEDLSRHVLKPLFSFAGAGVKLAPTRAEIEAIPPERRGDWVLQERIEYAPAIPTPEGAAVKCEVRMMFVRRDDEDHLTLLLNLIRLSRGDLMGVDYNRGVPWTGSSVGLWPA